MAIESDLLNNSQSTHVFKKFVSKKIMLSKYLNFNCTYRYMVKIHGKN